MHILLKYFLYLKNLCLDNLYYLLSNAGLNLLGTKAQNVRIKENNIIVTTKDARVIKFNYNNIILFDDESVVGLPLPTKENKDFVVLDWIIPKSCQTHKHTFHVLPIWQWIA